MADPGGLNAPSLWVKLLVSEISIVYLMPSGGGGRIVMVSLVLALLRLINCCICTFSCSIHLCVYNVHIVAYMIVYALHALIVA